MTPDSHFLDRYMPTDPHMQIMWLASVYLGIKDHGLLDNFQHDTGNRWSLDQPPVHFEQCSADEAAFVADFARWFNRAIWGEVNGRACNGDETGVSHGV